MRYWQALQKVSEEQAISFKGACYYLIMENDVIKAVSIYDNKEINLPTCSINSEGWELYQMPHDFNWAKEQIQRNNIVRRKSWEDKEQYIARDSFGRICNFKIGPGVRNQYSLTIEDLNATDWVGWIH